MKRAAFVVGVMLAGCAFDPTGLAPRGGAGGAGELGDGGQVLVDAQAADVARDSAGDAGAQVDAQLPDAGVDAGLLGFMATCSSGAECVSGSCAPDTVSPRDLPVRKVCTHTCSSDGQCEAPSVGCTMQGTTPPGYCRGPRIPFLGQCELLTSGGGNFYTWCATSGPNTGCYAVGPASYPYLCTHYCNQNSDCPPPSAGCRPGGGLCLGP